MSLILEFVLVTLVLFGLFWGGSLVAQGYFYQSPADRLPLRAAVAALLVGLFTSFWVWLDKKHPGKYDTFFSFSGESTREFSEFDAVRWEVDPATKGLKKDDKGNLTETTTKFKRVPGGKTAAFVEEGTGKKFATHDTGMMTAALLVNADGETPTRFKAVVKKDDRTGQMNYAETSDKERRFVEENGSRYIKHAQLGVMYVPSGSVVAVALLLNLLLFVVWFAAFWPVLKFNWGHALGFAAAFGLAMMLLVLPLLFKPNREANKPREATPSARSLVISTTSLV